MTAPQRSWSSAPKPRRRTRLTRRGELLLALLVIAAFLILMSIVGGMDVASDLPNDPGVPA